MFAQDSEDLFYKKSNNTTKKYSLLQKQKKNVIFKLSVKKYRQNESFFSAM